MANDLIFTDREAEFLRELVRQKVAFMIVGLSGAALQGAPVVTQDVDLWFADVGSLALKAALGAVGGFYVPPTAHTPPMIGGESVKLFDLVAAMHGLRSFVAEYRQAVSINLGGLTVKVLPLQRIIASKRAAAAGDTPRP